MISCPIFLFLDSARAALHDSQLISWSSVWNIPFYLLSHPFKPTLSWLASSCKQTPLTAGGWDFFLSFIYLFLHLTVCVKIVAFRLTGLRFLIVLCTILSSDCVLFLILCSGCCKHQPKDDNTLLEIFNLIRTGVFMLMTTTATELPQMSDQFCQVLGISTPMWWWGGLILHMFFHSIF